MYGINSQPANFDILKNLIIVNNIKTKRTIIVIKPNNGDFKPKKAIDQKELRTSCAANMPSATFIFFCACPSEALAKEDQTKNKATPIKQYKEIQTGANNQLGGLKKGLFKVKYHVETDLAVKTDPITPAN